MRAFGLLIFLAGIFVLFNSPNIREVLQGKSRINLINLGGTSTTKKDTSTTPVITKSDSSGGGASGSF